MACEQNHPWCRDVSRDEAIRAAEDAAAEWRDLEVGEVIEEGDEYLDQHGLWRCVNGVTRGRTYGSRSFARHRRRRVPPPDHRDLPSAVHDLRRRVEGLEAVADHWRRQCEADADAENREAAPGSRDGVTAATAANAGGEANNPAAPDSSPEPVAWVATKPGDDGGYQRCLGWDRHKVILGIDLDASSHPVSVSPLYAAPQPPRGWLTSEERKAVGDAATALHQLSHYKLSLALRALLARETPPRVKSRGPWTINGVPGDGSQAWKPMIDTILSRRDDEWIAAIRAAGGEVAQ